MKKFILILVLLITGLTTNFLNAQGSWTLQTNPTTASGLSIQFVSVTEGWIDLQSNALLHTTNGGANWNVVIPNSTDIAYGENAPSSRLSFINSSVGWALKSLGTSDSDSQGAVLYKTINSGVSWQRKVLSTTAGDIGIQVQFINATFGWVLIFNANTKIPTLLKTTDGGTTWLPLSISWLPSDHAGISYYVDAYNGWAFSYNPFSNLPPITIYKTTDGGTNWTSQYTDNTSGSFENMQFTDINHGWIVGKNGKIFKTINGGTTWTIVTNPLILSTYSFSAVFFINNDEGWIAGGESGSPKKIFKTTDGGVTWSTQDLPVQYTVLGLSFWDANHGWAISDYDSSSLPPTIGEIISYSVPLGVNDNIAKNKIIIFPNPSNGRFYIDIKEVNSKMRLEIFNVWGQKIQKEVNLKQSTNEIDLSSYSKGVYFIKINDGENNYAEKIVIQ